MDKAEEMSESCFERVKLLLFTNLSILFDKIMYVE